MEFVTFLGPSGCGKTTFGRTVLQLYNPTSGKIIYDGKTIFEGKDPWQKDENGILRQVKVPKAKQVNMLPYRRKMQIIFQDPFSSLQPRMPVGEIIGEAVREHGLVPKEQFDDYVTKVMKDCGLQEYHKDRYPHEFSGGQRQRVAIARALINDPAIIMADEPTGNLDTKSSYEIMDIFKKMNDNGKTVVMVTHEPDIAEQTKRILTMRDGKLVSDEWRADHV